MSFVDMQTILDHAHRHRYAVGDFDLVSLDFLEAIVAGADAQRAPVILSLAEIHFECYDFELAMSATLAAAPRTTRVPGLHRLDENGCRGFF